MSDNQFNSPIDDEDSRDSSDILHFSTSPYDNLDAIVQHDGRSIYFYLNGRDTNAGQPFGTRACWIRNLQQGPYVISEDEMRDGIAPMLPRTHCKTTMPGKLPCPDDLKIIWFEEGNGAALLETNTDQKTSTTLAVIPPWSGVDGFHGYAAECAAESQLCWPLPENPQFQQRIERAEEFWKSFSQQPDPFAILQPEILKAFEARFGNANDGEKIEPRYFSIDGGSFPPRGLIHYKTNQRQILATVGMSLCPQPMVEMFTDDPKQFRRIELAIELGPETDSALVNKVSKTISSLAAYPWRRFNWFGPGHTCQFADLMPDIESAVFVHDRSWCFPSPVELPKFRGDPINLLWILPLTVEQQLALELNETSVAELRQNR